jgi:hypothetical protein
MIRIYSWTWEESKVRKLELLGSLIIVMITFTRVSEAGFHTSFFCEPSAFLRCPPDQTQSHSSRSSRGFPESAHPHPLAASVQSV